MVRLLRCFGGDSRRVASRGARWGGGAGGDRCVYLSIDGGVGHPLSVSLEGSDGYAKDWSGYGQARLRRAGALRCVMDLSRPLLSKIRRRERGPLHLIANVDISCTIYQRIT